MAEKTDAFGNPIGPQQAQGVPGGPTVGGSRRPSESGLPDTKSATTGVPQQYDTQLASSGPQASNESFGRTRGVSFGTISLAIFLIIIVVGVGLVVALGVFSGAKNAYNDVKDSVNDSVNSASSNGSGRKDASGISAPSMLSPQKFGQAKRLLASSGQGNPYIVAIYPMYLSAQLIKGDTQASVLVNNDSDSANVQSTSSASPALTPFKLSRVADGTPARVVKRAAAASNQKSADIQYVVIQKVVGPGRIQAYFKNGTRYSANLNGKDLKKEA
jgi:hypothetical protein